MAVVVTLGPGWACGVSHSVRLCPLGSCGHLVLLLIRGGVSSRAGVSPHTPLPPLGPGPGEGIRPPVIAGTRQWLLRVEEVVCQPELQEGVWNILRRLRVFGTLTLRGGPSLFCEPVHPVLYKHVVLSGQVPVFSHTNLPTLVPVPPDQGPGGVLRLAYSLHVCVRLAGGGVNARSSVLSPGLVSIVRRRSSGSARVTSATMSAMATAAFGPDPSLSVSGISTATYLRSASSTTVLFVWHQEHRSRNHPDFFTCVRR